MSTVPTDLEACAAWIESLASPTLAGDPFIRAADWAAKLVREYAHALTLPPETAAPTGPEPRTDAAVGR